MRERVIPECNNTFVQHDLEEQDNQCENNSRRGFLSGTVSASLLLGGAVLGSSFSPSVKANQPAVGPQTQTDRQLAAQQLRIDAANLYLTETLPPQLRNDDEVLYNDLRATFGKTMNHKAATFETLNGSYSTLLAALQSGDPADFAAIQQAPFTDRKLANPQAAFSYDLTGGDAHESRIRIAPAFDGAEQAAEMAEVYWNAITRDVPFIEFKDNSLIADAIDDLNNFSVYIGPKGNKPLKPKTIFRGVKGGPFISQFLLQDVPYGPSTIVQRYASPVAGVDFMTDSTEWLRIQKGRFPQSSLSIDPVNRYIYNQRVLGEYVHRDVVAQAYINAALIMLSYGPGALSTSNPYSSDAVQGGFVTFGVPNIIDMINRAATIALKTAWYQKWLVHRRLRPEVFAMRVTRQFAGFKNYGVNAELMNSNAVAVTMQNNASSLALLPQAYPEGSPTHPSYPAGHATIAGACSLILKAFFNPDFVIPNTVEANSDGTALLPYTKKALTIGKEIDKLALNVTLGRDAAGVHYRSDGVEGIVAGEQVAVGLLQDASITYNEIFDGFTVKRIGKKKPYLIKDGVITRI